MPSPIGLCWMLSTEQKRAFQDLWKETTTGKNNLRLLQTEGAVVLFNAELCL